jgi:predicted PP-loop superfamily ATPase
MLPRENLKTVQDLTFILVYKIGLTEKEVLETKRWVLKRRMSQYEEYQKAKADELKAQMAQTKTSNIRSR